MTHRDHEPSAVTEALATEPGSSPDQAGGAPTIDQVPRAAGDATQQLVTLVLDGRYELQLHRRNSTRRDGPSWRRC